MAEPTIDKLDHIAILRAIAEGKRTAAPAKMIALRDIRQIERQARGELTGDIHDMDRAEIQAEIRHTRALIEAMHGDEGASD